ncbi:MAG: hypothetical protein IKS71_00230 [Bacteroidales bacterium]|nr:hypothetical protein [Bacteroidales bacterium]
MSNFAVTLARGVPVRVGEDTKKMTSKTRSIALVAIVAFAAVLFAIPSCKREQTPKIYSISASVDTLKIAGDGDTTQIALTANSEWFSDLRVNWITLDPAEGEGDATLTVAVAPNIKNANRAASIYFGIKGQSGASTQVIVVQAPSGKEDPDPVDPTDPTDPTVPEEDNSSVVIPKANFAGETTWSVIGSLGGDTWSKDIAMLAEPEYGWVAAFDITVGTGEEFKFRQGADWAVNLGAGAGMPAVDVRYSLAENGGNIKLAAGTYDLYLHPTYSLLYVEEAGATFSHGDAVPSAQTSENVRIYVLNNSSWTKPYMYAYVGSGELQPYGGWPGTYASGTKQIGEYTWTYWEASGFNGVGNVNLILNNNGAVQHPAQNETEPLWSGLTIMNTLYFTWDGTTVTQVEDPSAPGVSGKGIEPDEMKFGSSSWTIIGTLGGTNWDYDFPMNTEGYWEIAREVSIAAGEQFKFRQNRGWDVNLGCGEYSETGATNVALDTKISLAAGAGNMSVSADGVYDIYLSVENKIAYVLTAGASWTHENDGKPDNYLAGEYSSTISPADKLSGLTYQVNVFSFKDSNGDGWGDFNGLTQSLDYFDQLGVTALWLSPVQPAQSYHGYDVTDYETVNSHYGTEADFQNLIKEAHKHNIRIYMDYVMNHAGDQSKWFLDVLNKGKESAYWDYFSLSKDPDADVKAGKIAQVPASWGCNTYKWFPVNVGGKGQKRYKVDLDWTNASAPKMTVTETSAAVTTSGSHDNPARYLYWGDGRYSQFVDDGKDKYTLILDYNSSWGCLVRTTNQDKWTDKTKWGFNKSGDQMKLGEPHILYSDDNPDKVQTIVMPGGEIYYYYSEFGTGSFVDFNYGAASDCQNSKAFKAIMVGVEKWLKMGVDGFRLDAVKHIYADENGPENVIFWNKFYEAANAIYKANASARADLTGVDDENIFMVGEVLSGDGQCTPFYAGLPALFEFQFWWDLCKCLNGETIYNAGYGQNFPGSLKYRWDGHKGVRGNAIATPKLANHDEDRTASSLGNYKPKIRLAAAVLLTSPGRPFIYQGEELGYWGTKSGGDEYVRTPILWTESKSSAAVRGVSNKVDWDMLKPSISVEAQSADETSLLMLYRHFGYARNINRALADGWPEPDERTMGGFDGKVAGWYMHECVDNGKVALVLHNFSSYTQNVQRWPGENATTETILVANGRVTVTANPDGNIVTLPPYSSVVFALN